MLFIVNNLTKVTYLRTLLIKKIVVHYRFYINVKGVCGGVGVCVRIYIPIFVINYLLVAKVSDE